jgi:hypothetical protein
VTAKKTRMEETCCPNDFLSIASIISLALIYCRQISAVDGVKQKISYRGLNILSSVFSYP